MKISLGETNGNSRSANMKMSSSSNLLVLNKNYANKNGPMNRLCIIIRWRTGTCVFASLLLVVCLIKLYMASMTSEPSIESLDTAYFHHTVAATQKDKFFGIMVDAGSTGSRVHVYEFKNDPNSAAPVLVDELFEQVKPGLSSYADDPKEGANSIKQLLDIAKNRVPKSEWSKTPISLKATAGLRLLPIEKAEALIKEVEDLFSRYPFVLAKSPVSVMDGTDEGIYGWISVNYLLKRLGGASNQFTVGCIDLGGGSMQITFAPHELNTVENASKGFVSDISVFNSKVKLYTHSYLGFGLMSAREASMGGSGPGNEAQVRTACMPQGYNDEWSNGPNKYIIEGATGIDNTRYELCRIATDKAVDGKISHPEEIKHQSFYIFSYFFDRATQAKLIDPKLGGKLRVTDYVRVAKQACTDDAFDKENPFFCMDLCILSSFLEVGFRFSPETEFRSIRTIDDKETSWTLGATFFMMNDL